MTKQGLEQRLLELKGALCDINDDIGKWQGAVQQAQNEIKRSEIRGIQTVGMIMEVKTQLQKFEEAENGKSHEEA